MDQRTAGGDHLVNGFGVFRPLGGLAQEAGGGEAGELIADEEMVKRLIVEMVGVIPSLQELAERLGFLVAGQSKLWIKPDDAVPKQGSGTPHGARIGQGPVPRPRTLDGCAPARRAVGIRCYSYFSWSLL